MSMRSWAHWPALARCRICTSDLKIMATVMGAREARALSRLGPLPRGRLVAQPR